MNPEYCEIEQIDSMVLSKYQKISIQNGDGNKVFIWSRYNGERPTQLDKPRPELIVESKKVLLRPQIEEFQKRLQQRLHGGCWHEIDD